MPKSQPAAALATYGALSDRLGHLADARMADANHVLLAYVQRQTLEYARLEAEFVAELKRVRRAHASRARRAPAVKAWQSLTAAMSVIAGTACLFLSNHQRGTGLSATPAGLPPRAPAVDSPV
jgi:hypothetical protein